MSDMTNLLFGIDGMDDECTKKIIKAPFAYPGGKSRSLKYILPRLPKTDRWCDAFGGSGIVTLNRTPSKMEVYNDRFSGVVDFFRCMRDDEMFKQLYHKIDYSIHSREDFTIAKADWENHKDPVQRAFLWYYMVTYSFASLSRNFGRSTQSSIGRLSGRLADRLPDLQIVKNRFKYVQVENLDILQLLDDYDHPEMVFYLDPPYIESSPGIYKWEMSPDQHERMLDKIFSLKGFVAISGYTTELYEQQPWDNRFEWESMVSLESPNLESNNKSQYRQSAYRQKAKEVLWIKEFA